MHTVFLSLFVLFLVYYYLNQLYCSWHQYCRDTPPCTLSSCPCLCCSSWLLLLLWVFFLLQFNGFARESCAVQSETPQPTGLLWLHFTFSNILCLPLRAHTDCYPLLRAVLGLFLIYWHHYCRDTPPCTLSYWSCLCCFCLLVFESIVWALAPLL